MSSTDDRPTPGGRGVTPRLLAIGAVALVVVIVIVVLLTHGGDDHPGSTAGGGNSPSPSQGATGSPRPSSPGASTSKSPPGSATPGQGSGTSSPVLSAGKPVRATFSQTAKPSPSLVVDLTRVEKIQAKAEIPGEVSGPALRITVSVHNSTQKVVPIKTALTNLYYGSERTPATQMTHPGAKAFPEKVPAGGAVTGVVIFTVPPKQRGDVVLEVIIDAQMRRIEFAGNCTGQC